MKIARKSHTHLLIAMVGLTLIACQPAASNQVAVTAPATQPATAPTQPALELEPTYAALIAEQRDPAVPELPFADNPDPTQCGIPIQWGDANNIAYLNGIYDGVMVQQDVLLYDSHLRLGITGQAPHGAEVEIVLYQQNPVIDYYFVKVASDRERSEGWVPAPFLSFEAIR